MNSTPSVSLQLNHITKSFPGVVALDDVSFDLRPGEVHSLVGENGAGKSTLIHIISGVLSPDSGELLLENQLVQLSNPVAARNRGIVTVHQEADFFPTLSVAENMALLHGFPTGARGLINWTEINRRACQNVATVDEKIDVSVPAAQLSVAHRHMTHIASAVLQHAKIVILDEPTSALTAIESDWIFQQISRLKMGGAGIIYISHRQEEILTLSDRITVLRDGRKMWTRDRTDVDGSTLLEAMVGRRMAPTKRAPRRAHVATSLEHPRLRIRGLSDSRRRFYKIDIDVHAGEVVGVYGLVGAGRTELAHRIFGLDTFSEGTIEVDGQQCVLRHPQDAVAHGIAYVPEDRLREGLCRGLSIRANTVLPTLSRMTLGGDGNRWKWFPRLFTSHHAEKTATNQMMKRLAVRHRNIEQCIGQLSGGNQQKVVLGRWLLAKPKVMILDEPTRGVDIGAKAEIHRLLRQIADQGSGIVMISSDLSEILQHSDRILVLRAGQVSAQFDAQDVTATEVAKMAFPDESNSAANSTDRKKISARPFWLASEMGLAVLALLLSIWLGATSENFFAWSNLGNLFAETALWTILGIATATVILPGAIDISIGSLLALSAACAGLVLKLPWPPAATIPTAVVTAISVGTMGGLLNGTIALVGRIHPIVVTLGMMIVYRGLVIALVSGRQISNLPRTFGWLSIHPESGFRGSVLLGAVIATVMFVVFSYTRPGRYLYAIGSSSTAARLVGISKSKIWLFAFGLGGLLTGIAALLELSSSTQMQSQLAKGWELQAIAVAVIGGVSITGGRGSVVGVVLGALLLRLVNSALVRWEIRGEQVDVFVGGMILGAVLLDLFWRKHKQ